MAVLLEASLAVLLLGWHIVCDVRVVALLREPDNNDDDGIDENLSLKIMRMVMMMPRKMATLIKDLCSHLTRLSQTVSST